MNSTLDAEEILQFQKTSEERSNMGCSPRISKKAMSAMSKGKQKISAQKLDMNSPLRELMLFITLASSTMQTFAMVVLIPSLCRYHHEAMTSLEIGLLIAAATAGDLVAYRYSEPCISKFGIKWSLHLGFLAQIATSYAFWQVSFIENDSDFATLAFLARFGYGLGGGLLR